MAQQNRSTAVMQRRSEPPDSLDDFPTPPWATRALCEFLRAEGYPLHRHSAWEPSCNRMHMVRPLREYCGRVRASDAFRYGDHELIDFAVTGRVEPRVDWIVSNPPFRLAEAFIRTALERSRIGCAMLVRMSFKEGVERYRALFRPGAFPPTFELVFTERVVMLKGRLVRAGAIDPFSDPPGRKASTATSYVWLVWIHDAPAGDTRTRWLAPCRLQLERPGDYPIYDLPAPIAPAEPLLEGAGP